MIEYDQSGLGVERDVIDRLVERVWNPLELKVVISVLALGGRFEPVRERTIVEYQALRRGAHGDGSSRPVEERIRDALDGAVIRQVLVPFDLGDGERGFALWTEDNLQQSSSGGYRPEEGRSDPGAAEQFERVRPGIFTEYEQHIGVLTPVVADRLADAIERYPRAWVSEAIEQAAIYNRRSLRYVERILENWATEGRNGEADRRDHEGHSDPGSRLRDKVQPYLRERE